MSTIEQVEKILEEGKDTWTPELNAHLVKTLKETAKVVEAAQGKIPDNLVEQIGVYIQQSLKPAYFNRILISGKLDSGARPLFDCLKEIAQPYLKPKLRELFEGVQAAIDGDCLSFTHRPVESLVELILGKKGTMLYLKLQPYLASRIDAIGYQTAEPVTENGVHLFSFMNMSYLASGGCAEVYKADFFGQEVAVKVLKSEDVQPAEVPALVETPDSGNAQQNPSPSPSPPVPSAAPLSKVEQEFAAELKQLERLSSPYVVRLFGSYASHRLQFFVLELMGPSLDTILYRKEAGVFVHDFPWARRYQAVLEIALGLQYLHNISRVVHCDLKPANILTDKDGHCKISDFGIALNKHSAGSLSHLQGKGAATVPFMAPELLLAEEERAKKMPMLFSWKTDIYALGMILWQIASREKPYSTVREQALLETLVMAVRYDGQREDLPENTPAEFAELITRCWAQEPTERPRIDQVVDDIQAILKRT